MFYCGWTIYKYTQGYLKSSGRGASTALKALERGEPRISSTFCRLYKKRLSPPIDRALGIRPNHHAARGNFGELCIGRCGCRAEERRDI